MELGVENGGEELLGTQGMDNVVFGDVQGDPAVFLCFPFFQDDQPGIVQAVTHGRKFTRIRGLEAVNLTQGGMARADRSISTRGCSRLLLYYLKDRLEA